MRKGKYLSSCYCFQEETPQWPNHYNRYCHYGAEKAKRDEREKLRGGPIWNFWFWV